MQIECRSTKLAWVLCRNIVPTRAEPSILGLCRVQSIFNDVKCSLSCVKVHSFFYTTMTGFTEQLRFIVTDFYFSDNLCSAAYKYVIPYLSITPPSAFWPIKTPGNKVQLSPNLALPLTIIGPQCHIVRLLPQVPEGIWNPVMWLSFLSLERW